MVHHSCFFTSFAVSLSASLRELILPKPKHEASQNDISIACPSQVLRKALLLDWPEFLFTFRRSSLRGPQRKGIPGIPFLSFAFLFLWRNSVSREPSGWQKKERNLEEHEGMWRNLKEWCSSVADACTNHWYLFTLIPHPITTPPHCHSHLHFEMWTRIIVLVTVQITLHFKTQTRIVILMTMQIVLLNFWMWIRTVCCAHLIVHFSPEKENACQSPWHVNCHNTSIATHHTTPHFTKTTRWDTTPYFTKTMRWDTTQK